MGCFHNCSFHLVTQQLIIISLFLLISSVTHCRFMAEGRAISKQLIVTQELEMGSRKEENENPRVMVVRRNMIGSRPPRCNRKCRNCGHCEAIQVPVAPQLIKAAINTRKEDQHLYANPSMAYSRGDGVSNYKPMSWKCKCGDFLFNP